MVQLFLQNEENARNEESKTGKFLFQLTALVSAMGSYEYSQDVNKGHLINSLAILPTLG
jgi:hypothetical protein